MQTVSRRRFLEGSTLAIAAGCAVVASAAGGLPEAVGPCGLLFQNGDAAAMASALLDLLAHPSRREQLMKGSVSHLKSFEPEIIAAKYLEVFASALHS